MLLQKANYHKQKYGLVINFICIPSMSLFSAFFLERFNNCNFLEIIKGFLSH